MTTWQNARKAFDRQLALNLKELDNYPSHWSYFVDCVSAIKKNINRVVDIGCGIGAYYVLCEKHFPELKYVGIDYSPYAISLAMTHWDYTSFLTLDYKELSPRYFTNKDLLVANALCDVLENGDECLDFILGLDVPYVMLQRVKLTKKESFYKRYRAYREVDTVEFYHNQNQLSETIARHKYLAIFDIHDEQLKSYNIFLIKSALTLTGKSIDS